MVAAYPSPVAYYQKNVEGLSFDPSGCDEGSCESYKIELVVAHSHRRGIGEVSFESFDVVDGPFGADLARGRVYSTIRTKSQRRTKAQKRATSTSTPSSSISKRGGCRKTPILERFSSSFLSFPIQTSLPSPTLRYREIPLSNRPSFSSRRRTKYLTIGPVPSGHHNDNNGDAQMLPTPRVFYLSFCLLSRD